MCYVLHIFVAVGISFDQSSYYASEAQDFMNVSLVSSQPVDFPYSIVILLQQLSELSATGEII